MDRRKSAGAAIFCLCIVGFFTYAYLVMLSEWGKIVLELSVLMMVGAILGTVAWIGYMMVTTRPTPFSIGSDGYDGDDDDSGNGNGDNDGKN